MGVDKTGDNKYPVSVQYTVRNGDNLTTISKATGIPISILAKDNNIPDIDKIYTGQILTFNYHPEEWETSYTPETHYVFQNRGDVSEFLSEMDQETEDRYKRIAKDGAQKHLDTKW